jgi:lipid II:glycine glycyltransferase (peptidoglycan interpeptide bridge formation enzyme)
MIHADHTVTYILANYDESFNKEMASDGLEWHVMNSPNKRTRVVFWPAGL